MLLAIDTSGSFCSAALFDPQHLKVCVQRSDEIGRGHAEHLMPMLENLMNEAGLSWSDIHHVVSVTGPGSFTGVRVGLATAKGLTLGLTLGPGPAAQSSGVSVFQAIAHQLKTERPLVVLLDAKRSELWFQIFDARRHSISEPGAVKIDEALHTISEYVDLETVDFAGSGASMVQDSTNSAFQPRILSHAGSPDIVAVAEFASLEPRLNASLKPLYIREPDAKPQSIGAKS